MTFRFPPTRLVMPLAEYAPDYFTFGPHVFCSRRLREVLAQPREVLRFLPVDVVAGRRAVRIQDYREMHILAQQPAMDMQKSVYQTSEIVQHTTERALKRVRWIELLVLIDGLQPRTEIFRADETKRFTLVTDALAARVLRSGCTGLSFRDPVAPLDGMRVERIRTKTGMAERRVGFLD